MHINSIKAYYEEKKKLSRRALTILNFLESCYTPKTDRHIMVGLGFHEPNAVRPRITEMIAKGLVIECGSTPCKTTGKTVRLVKAVQINENPQQEMNL